MTIAAAPPVRAASDKQRNMIRSLATERVLPAEVAATAIELASKADFSIGEASKIITELMKAPRKPRAAAAAPAAPVAAGWDAVNRALADIPDAKFAIKIDDFTDPLIEGMAAGQPMVFFEARTWRGRKMLKKLLGAPGGFSRVSMTPAANLAVIRALSADPIAASRLFGEHYSVCGKCAAELTDEVSRRVQFGPTCRAVLGIEV